MQAIRQIIETKKLKELIDIPEDFSEIIAFTMLTADTGKFRLNPEPFFGASHLKDVDA